MIKMQETNRALKGFANKYTIDGWEGVDENTFLEMVEPGVIDLLKTNTQKIVHFVLTCAMKRRDIKTGEVITKTFPFHSFQERVLEASDMKEISSA